MKLVEDIKNYIGRWELERELKTKKLKRKRVPFHEVNHIGIVYDADNKDDELIVTQYANELRVEGKKVFLMGYVDQKQLPPSKKFMLNSEFFWKEKLNGINLPIKGKIGQFLQLEFDLLLNLYFEPVLPMQALSAYSHAKYRVASNIGGGLDYYDAMIDIGPQKDISLLIKQMDFYLRAI
ncbi:MAG: hypothetical protein V4590_07520 [Bacteroidota bacterium]